MNTIKRWLRALKVALVTEVRTGGHWTDKDYEAVDLATNGRWKVQGEPPTRPGFKYQPTFFDDRKEALSFAERLRRDGCYVPEPELVSVDVQSDG